MSKKPEQKLKTESSQTPPEWDFLDFKPGDFIYNVLSERTYKFIKYGFGERLIAADLIGSTDQEWHMNVYECTHASEEDIAQEMALALLKK